MHQYPGVHATVLLYQRSSKPRVRQKDPNQSNIRAFFPLSWYILARPHMYLDMVVYKLNGVGSEETNLHK